MIQEIADALAQSWHNFATAFIQFIPGLIAAAIIFAVGFFLSLLARRIVARLLAWLRFERLAQRLGASEMLRVADMFKLDGDGHPTVVAGVPPDYFSATGQLWGNPHYRWDVLERTGYAWWIERFRSLLALVDRIRIDHFRGFVASWEIPGGATAAVDGAWVSGPGSALFEAVRAALGTSDLPFVAENLGVMARRGELQDDAQWLRPFRIRRPLPTTRRRPTPLCVHDACGRPAVSVTRGRQHRRPPDGTEGARSDDDVVECALIRSGVVLAADLEIRRIGEHAVDLFLGRWRVPVPAPPGRGRELHREGRPVGAGRRAEPVREPACGSHDDHVVIEDAGNFC
jgi:hypothetical protein